MMTTVVISGVDSPTTLPGGCTQQGSGRFSPRTDYGSQLDRGLSRVLQQNVDEILAPFAGVHEKLTSRHVLVKPNAVHFSPQTHTDPAVLEAVLIYLRDLGCSKISVMENATGGNLTRLVFETIGYRKLCKRYGATPIHLDEGPTRSVRLHGEHEKIRISRRLHDSLIVEREQHFYLSLPKLKTHSMATVTLGVKNQQAFPIHADRMHRHNHATLHRRLARLYELLRPDFCIIDGLNAIINGHVPPTALLDECVVPMGVLIGGDDTLAVDTVGARVLGYTIDEVEHLRLCQQWALGEGRLEHIEIKGESLSRFKERYPYRLLGRTHPDVTIIEGRQGACVEGCKGNSLCLQEMLTNDYGGHGGWTLVFGRDIDCEELALSPGPVLAVGGCATSQLRGWLHDHQPGRRAYFIDTCNDLKANTTYQARLMRVKPLDMSPLHPLKSAWLLLLAKLHRSSARIPSIMG